MPLSPLGLGQSFRHGQFESYVYEVAEGAHVVCYGRGFIPASSLWTVTGAISTADPLSVVKLTYVYGRSVANNIASSATGIFNQAKDKASKFEL